MSGRDEGAASPTDLRDLASRYDAGDSLAVPILRRIARTMLDQGYLAEAETLLFRAFGRAVSGSDRRLAVLIVLDLARCMLGRSPRRAIELLEGMGLDSVENERRASFLNLMGAHYFDLQEFEVSLQYLELAREEIPSRTRGSLSGYVVENLAGNAFECGDHEKTDELHRVALDTLTTSDELASTGIVRYNMAMHTMYVREYDRAARCLEHGRAISERCRNLRVDALLNLAQGELSLSVGDVEPALDHFRSSERKAALASLPAVQARALVWRTIVQSRGRAKGLGHDIRAAAQDLEDRDLRSDSGHVWLISALHAEHLGTPRESLYDRSKAILGTAQPSYLKPHYARMMQAATAVTRSSSTPFSSFVTRSGPVIRTKERLRRLVNTDMRILIEGESGTGKTFLARMIHEQSRRRRRAFVVVDCTNLEENLFESKLFGHLKGSFTGASGDSVGLVEQADGGTLFLDEVGEMPVEIQAKLLYTIEEQKYRPVGSRVERESDFHVIAATNRDIDEMLAKGTLRRDLFHRLSGFRVRLPSLRERREDIQALVELQLRHLAERYGRTKTLKVEVWEALLQHDWPGNVRELNTVLERGYHLTEGRRIGLEEVGLGESGTTDPSDLAWDTIRREHLLRVLRLCRGNVTRASRLLGINRTTLIYKLKLLDIERPDFDPKYRVDVEDPEETRHVAEPDR